LSNGINKKFNHIFRPEEDTKLAEDIITREDIFNARMSLTGSTPIIERIYPVFAKAMLETFPEKLEMVVGKKIDSLSTMGKDFLIGKESETGSKATGLHGILENQLSRM